MRKTKELLRLRFELGLGQRQIARSCGMGLGKVHDYLERAAAAATGLESIHEQLQQHLHLTLHQFVGDVYKEWNPASYEANEFVIDGRVAGQAAGVNQQGVREGLEPSRYAAPLNPEANKPQQ